MSFLKLNKICKKYDGKVIFEDFSFELKKGERVAVMGASGAGKTTLLRIIAGLERADGGEIENNAENISFVFQENRLCEDFSALSNIRFVTGNTVSREEILSVLSKLGLKDFADMPVKNMSGGMKRRVAIARALIAPYDLLVLDEPLKGLDEELKFSVMEYIKEKSLNKTLILVTHNVDETEYLCDRIINIYKT